MSRAGWLASGVWCALAITAAPALANVAAAQRNPAALSTSATTPTAASVLAARLTFDCRDDGHRAPVCDFVVQYDVEGGPQDEQLAAAFTTVLAEDVTVRVEGEEVARRDGSAQWVAFTTDLPAAALVAIEVRGTVRPGLHFKPTGYVWPAVNVRHFGVTPAAADRYYDLDYLVAPIRSFASVGKMSVTVRYPAAWELYGQFDGYGPATRSAEQRPEVRGDVAEATWAIDPGVVDVLSFGFVVKRPVVQLGGPVVHAGGVFGAPGGPRLRLGWEIAAPDWLLYGLHVETGFGDHAAIVPMVTAASPFLLIFPSVDVGLGAPVRFVPRWEAGVRAEIGMHLLLFGVAATFDFWPSHPVSDDAFFDAGLAARIAF